MSDSNLNTSEEVWKDIPEFPGYEVSNRGRMRSYFQYLGYGRWEISNEPQRFMSQHPDRKGYLTIALVSNSGRYTLKVSRTVLLAFIGPCPQGMESCHNDGVKSNNHLYNLRWDTPKNNCKDKKAHGTENIGMKSRTSKLCDAQIYEIRRLHKYKYPVSIIAKLFNINRSNAWHILHRKTWTHLL